MEAIAEAVERWIDVVVWQGAVLERSAMRIPLSGDRFKFPSIFGYKLCQFLGGLLFLQTWSRSLLWWRGTGGFCESDFAKGQLKTTKAVAEPDGVRICWIV